MNLIDISFVIPAFNEEQSLPAVIQAITDHVPGHYSHEVIVVDHGSEDATAAVSAKAGATVLTSDAGSIAALRNIGAAAATGDILIFVDADVYLTRKWSANISDTITMLRTGERAITGSWYGVSLQPSWLELSWFEPLLNGQSTHINSGHLIVTKQLFSELNGFSEHLETGEDYDFSMRAKSLGIAVIDNQELHVVHEGYPKTVSQFVRRETWHGKSDYQSIRTIAQSKVAILSLLFLSLHLISIYLLGSGAPAIWSSLAVGLILAICMISSYIKYRGESQRTILVNAYLYYVYFWARTFSFFIALIQPKVRKRAK